MTAIGGFFRDLCSRTLQQDRLETLKGNIVIILCNLEKIFPPSFFDVMEHLALHLPYEAQLGGPVQYRWMYPPERLFKHFKGKAKNKRYPAGSIVQSYLNDEISYFSEHYFAANIRTKASVHEQEIRYYNPHLSDEEVMLKRDDEFAYWVRNYVNEYTKNRTSDQERFPTWVDELVQGPRTSGKSWPMYFTRGYLFHTREYGQNRQTMNYGVCVRGQNYSDAADEDDFYGNLVDIIQLRYQGLLGLRITLFKCEWYDPTIGRGTRHREGGIVDVLATGKYRKYEPFILDSQADQVCYIPYPCTRSSRGSWLNVVKVNPRGNIQGQYKGKGKELILLQQERDDNVLPAEDIPATVLADYTNPLDYLDTQVRDADPEDEFHCNLSSSDDDEEEDQEDDEEGEGDE